MDIMSPSLIFNESTQKTRRRMRRMLECKRATRQEGAYTPEARVNVGYHSEHIGIQLDECTGVHQSDRMHDTKITPGQSVKL